MQKLLTAFLFSVCSCVFCFAQSAEPKPAVTPASGSGSGGETQTSQPSKSVKSEPLRILSKPRAIYTEVAKINDVEGAVRVRVTFLASGEIGSVMPVTGLPYGLTEQAVTAARKIKFEPQIKDGIPVSVTKVVEYTFSMYYRENDPDLTRNAEILKMPEPEHPQKKDLRELGGRVQVKVVFEAEGNVRIVEVITDLPKEFADAARKAAAEIKFDPAVHKNGNLVTQSKVIEYEFKPRND